ncbi:uncharacterized protein LOC116295064 [Actinia tenebrosa]|uniref:Uncharacterized protein LOC116295064 n=1 Tax=Actinia tenebrosa TaxID=6105 RepID=A0A6P8I182_ACTTE|nr:uncharacterized protein LOC116295064 [Actinia tenebrosa]
MEVSKKSRRGRRPEQAIYITPGRRSMINLNTQASHSGVGYVTGISTDSSNTDNGSIITLDDVMNVINSKDDNISEDVIVKILNFFRNLDDSQGKAMEASLIKFSVLLIEREILSPSIMEKLVVTLILVGRKLEQDHSKELDSLLAVMRDEFIKKDTSPETRRQIMSVIESRARNWGMTRHV